MKIEFKFDSCLRTGVPICNGATTEEIKREPMLFNCSAKWAEENGGPFTKLFLAALKQEWSFEHDNVVVDSRVHMLMPGWWPCVPGWHHDDVPRCREDGQPNYVDMSYRAEHCMMLLNGDIAPTRFALGQITLPDVPLGKVFYREWHPLIERQIESGNILLSSAQSDCLLFFNWETFHEGVQAVRSGWRYFIRASRFTKRVPTNEIRNQVQVYLETPMDGW